MTAARLTLPLAAIVDDLELCPRVEIDAETWQGYADCLAEGVELPPVLVIRDGDVLWLADGYHRVRALRALAFESVEAVVIDGTKEDAIRAALAANATHGRPREPADLRRGYAAAVRNRLVEPDDVVGVARLLGCSMAWADVLTRQAREAVVMAAAEIE